MAMLCTIAVRTGTGDLAGAADSLHETSMSAAAETTAAVSRTNLHLMSSLLSERLLKVGLRAPEGEQALLILLIGVNCGCLLLQQIAQEDGGLAELIGHFAQFLIRRIARSSGHSHQRTALAQLPKSVVDVEQHLRASLLQLVLTLLDDSSFLLHVVAA